MTDNQMLTTEQVAEIRAHLNNAPEDATVIAFARPDAFALCATVEAQRRENEELRRKLETRQ
ncbi:MAG: hypothetical protein GEU71_03535 [Actinobacteria bacterium]|nr:hypothetical protein [Actinomycetota bacterium]